MTAAVAELTAALERVAAAMEAEVEAVRSGQAEQLATAAERKRLAIEAVEPVVQRFRDVTSAASPDERASLAEATRRMQAATARNDATLQGALQGTRRVYACLAEAVQAAGSSGTYRPDGSRDCAVELAGTIRRQA